MEASMGAFTRDELEQAFRHYWQTGAVGENWDAWADLFTEDAEYVEHVLGNLSGREAIRNWIKPIMAQYGEIYTASEWQRRDRLPRRQHPRVRRTAAVEARGGFLGRAARHPGRRGIRRRVQAVRSAAPRQDDAAQLGQRAGLDARRGLVPRALAQSALPVGGRRFVGAGR